MKPIKQAIETIQALQAQILMYRMALEKIATSPHLTDNDTEKRIAREALK